MKKYFFSVLLFVAFLFYSSHHLKADNVSVIFNKEKDQIVFSNGDIERVLQFDRQNHSFTTISLKNLKMGGEFCIPGSAEFSMRVNGVLVQGRGERSSFLYAGHWQEPLRKGGKQLSVVLDGARGTKASNLQVTINYQMYPGRPGMRKLIEIRNRGTEALKLTDFYWEDINVRLPSRGFPRLVETRGVYSRSLFRAPYTGGMEDPAITVFDPSSFDGFIVGNEAPGIMKQTSIFPDGKRIAIGMNSSDSQIPFVYYLEPGDTFKSPAGFILLFKDRNWEAALDNTLAPFVRIALPVQLYQREEIPLFVYNTWNPFRRDINDAVIRDLADAAAECGVEHFVLDDGWQTHWGDWDVDVKKFPDGLQTICDYIRSKGMKPGIWMSVATVHTSSNVVKSHPEWIMRDQKGELLNVHTYTPELLTMCMSTEWFDYIRNKIAYYVRSCRLGYVKLDIGSVWSAYVYGLERAGCYAHNHSGHKDRNASLWMGYKRAMNLFDSLKKEFPDLFIDCTFELWGYPHAIDYALVNHADGDWLCNIENLPPLGPLKVRQIGFDRAPVIPAASMVIGNQLMESPNHEYAFQSLVSYLPIMLGDPRKLSPNERKWYKNWLTWLMPLERKYRFMEFFQASDIFSRPTEDGWDGCLRFNPEREGGILCIYRHNSVESTRTFSLPWLGPDKRYRFYAKGQDRVLGIFTGKQLVEQGITITLPKKFQGEIISMERE